MYYQNYNFPNAFFSWSRKIRAEENCRKKLKVKHTVGLGKRVHIEKLGEKSHIVKLREVTHIAGAACLNFLSYGQEK